MTREERDVLAKACAYAANVRRHDVTDDLQAAQLDAAAAELRKTCATCKSFDEYSLECGNPQGLLNTDDGSGFCHRWESQPAGKAK